MARPKRFPTEREAEYQARVRAWELARIEELQKDPFVSKSTSETPAE